MRWDYFVNHYSDQARQEKNSQMTWRTPSGELFVGPNAATGTGTPPPGSTPLGILYPRAGTLGGCSAHNALITITLMRVIGRTLLRLLEMALGPRIR